MRPQPVPHFGVPFKTPSQRQKLWKYALSCLILRTKEGKENKRTAERRGTEVQGLPLPHFHTVNLPEKKVKDAPRLNLSDWRLTNMKAQT